MKYNDYYGATRERTYIAYNLHLLEKVQVSSLGTPIIENNGFIPEKLKGFSDIKTGTTDEQTGVHFYLDDYRFERIWREPERYVPMLSGYGCILSPDFSLYLDMPMSMKIWNVYRSRFIGAYYQSLGMQVIPTISWAEPVTYEFCFDGIPKGSIVSISKKGAAKPTIDEKKMVDRVNKIWYNRKRKQ